MVLRALALCLFLGHCVTCTSAQDDHDDHAGHDHGNDNTGADDCPWTKPWEWQAVFHFEGGLVFWNAEKAAATGNYADDTMKMLILRTNAASEAGMDLSERFAATAWNGSWSTAASGATLTVGQPYVLQFDAGSWMTSFKIDAPAESNLAIFAQHLPEEFENKLHYLIDADGHNVMPTVSASIMGCQPNTIVVGEETHERWLEVIGASLLTVVPTLFGIAFLVCTFSPAAMDKAKLFFTPMNSAASGVVFAAAVFLLLPEALLLIGGGVDEATAAGMWGAAILGGWLLGAVIDHACTLFALFLGRRKEGGSDAVRQVQESVQQEETEEKAACEPSEKTDRSYLGIAGPIIFGDMFHNLADGFVIGTAFKSCDASFAMKITAVTMAHEIPQELADFLVLVNKAGLHWSKAALLNFLSGLATLFGALVAHGVDVANNTEGVILAVGAGIYIYVACTELGPTVAHLGSKQAISPLLDSLTRLLAFILGATCIGLVLLDHAHCGAHNHGGSDASLDPHAGHNH